MTFRIADFNNARFQLGRPASLSGRTSAVPRPLLTQILNLRHGVTPNGRTTTTAPFVPTIGNLPGTMSWSVDGSGKVTITSNSYTSHMSNWNAAGMRLLVRSRIPQISQCIWGTIEIDDGAGGLVDIIRDTTVDGQGWDGFRRSGVLIGPALLVERCRFLGSYGDAINFGSGTTEAAGITFRWNYVRPGTNLPYNPLPWNSATAYAAQDFVRDANGDIWIARISSTNQPLPVSGESNTHWARWASSTSSGVLPLTYPHSDALVVKGSQGGGVLIERNLVDWTRDADGSLGFGPVLGMGMNNGLRFDPGNSSTTARRLQPLTFRENVMERGPTGGNSPIDLVHRNRPDNTGLAAITSNWLAPNENGRFISSNAAVDTWSGNLNLRTLTAITTPAGAMRGVPFFTGVAEVTGNGATLPLLTAGFARVEGGALNTLTYQWRRNGVAISGATSRTYQTVSPDDVGTNISVVLTGANAQGTAVSDPSAPFFIQSPFITFLTPPVLSGSAQVGATLTWTVGTHSVTPVTTRSVVFADGAAIPNVPTSATSYVLTADEIGKEIQVSVTVVAANGSEATAQTDPTEEVQAIPPQYFVLVLAGQSGQKYTYTGIADSTTFNSVTQYRPDLAAGDWGRVIEPVTESTVIPTIANGGLVDRAITTTNFQTKANDYLINRGVVALAQLVKQITNKTPIIVILSVGGTSLGQLMDDSETSRFYEPYKAAIDYVRANYGEVDLYQHFWHGTETPSNQYFARRAPHFFMQTSAGVAFVPGSIEPLEPVRVDHSIFDANAPLGQVGLGTLPRRVGTLVGITTLSNSGHTLTTRNSKRDLLNSAQMAGMGMLEPNWAPHGGHTEPGSRFGQPWTGMAVPLEPLMVIGGIGNRRPAVAGITAITGGTYAQVTIPVPIGHKLTTWRRRYNEAGGALTVPARVSPEPSEMDWFGFFIARNGVPINNRVPLTRAGSAGALNTQATITLENDGAATGTAVLRITPEVAFADGDRLTYRQTGTGAEYSYSLADSLNTPWADYLIVENPALWNPLHAFPCVGPQVVPMEVEATLSVTAPPPAVGDPQLLATYTPTATASVFESGTFTVPSGNGTLLVLTQYNSNITADEVVSHSTIGTSGRTQGTGTSLTLLNGPNTKSQNVAVLAYGIRNPGAGTYTWQFNVGATSIRHMRTQFVWVPNAVLPASAVTPQGVGGSSTNINFSNAPTATTALSLYAAGKYASATAWTVSAGTTSALDEGAGGGGGTSSTTQIRGIVRWAKYASTSSQAVTLQVNSSTRRVGLYLELVGG